MAELFRQEAVDTLNAPDRLDARLKVISPRHWIPLCAVCVLLLTVVGWGVWGRVSVCIEGRGILIRAQQVVELKAGSSARVARVVVEPGTAVRKGDVLAELESASDGARVSGATTIVAPQDGMLLDSILRPGWRIREGEVIGALGLFGDGKEQLCLGYLKLKEGQLARNGLRAFVVPEVARSAHLGAIEGRIVYVRPIPTDHDRTAARLGSKELAGLLVGTDRLAEVIIELPEAMRRTPEGEMIPVALGTLAGIKVEVERKPPVGFLFPFLVRPEPPEPPAALAPEDVPTAE